jgi:hypothetical protein
MPYKISNTVILTQPTAGKWIPREPLGIDGNGHAIYSSIREFELVWDMVDLNTAHQLQGFYDTVSITGSVVVSLPLFNDSGPSTGTTYYDYTGCVLREPEFGQYFDYYRQDVKLLIVRIRT